MNLDEEYARRHISVKPGPYVMMAVTDTGCGMDAVTRSHLFEPFFTTKEKGKGTGLGLSTVYGIIKQSGGNIWAYSEVGRGSTFKVYLPRAEGAVKSYKPKETAPAAAKGTETILLVEDEDAVRTMISRVLQGSGYTVLEACQGKEAIEVCRKHRGADPFDGNRCDHAANERTGAGGAVGDRPSGNESAIHVRISRQSDRPPRGSGSGDGIPAEALLP